MDSNSQWIYVFFIVHPNHPVTDGMSLFIMNWLMPILTLTPVRVVVIFLLPLLAFGAARFYALRIDSRVWVLLLLFAVSSCAGLVVHTTTLYSVLLSCIVFLPVLVLRFATPAVMKSRRMHSAARAFLITLLVIDALGLCFFLAYGGDEFGMPYGRHYEYTHGLGMVNTFVLLWYVMKFFYGEMKVLDWCIAAFIAIAWLCCQYGLGFVCLILTFVILLLTARKFKVLLFSALALAGAYLLLQTANFSYERENIHKLSRRTDARKLVMFDRFVSLLRNDPQVLVLGTGAGGYNGRVAQLLCGENDNTLNHYLGKVEPKYYKQDIYPLWNHLFVSQRKFNDGTRNKPFSSAVSLWAENGLLFFLLFCWLWVAQMRRLRYFRSDRVSYNYLLALDIFMFISLVSHMWLETSEFLVYILIRHTVLSNIQYKFLICGKI